MSSYTFISIIALYCYTFFLIAFLPAKRTRMIQDFIRVLLLLVLWTGGSLLMRLQMWPSYQVWFHISLAGICCLPYAYFCYVRDFLEEPVRPWQRLFLLILLAELLINAVTGWFVAPPELIDTGNGVRFVYVMDWHCGLLYGVVLVMMGCIGAMVYRAGQFNRSKAIQMAPLLFGMIVLFLGNLGVSVFTGFPIDILAGICNAVILFFTLYLGHMFKMTLIVSRRNCYLVAMIVSVLIVSEMARGLELFIQIEHPALVPYSAVIIAILTMLLTISLYSLLNLLFDRLFIKDEQQQTENIRQYSAEVSKSLNRQEIHQAMEQVVRKALLLEPVRVCDIAEDGSCCLSFSDGDEGLEPFVMPAGHPIIGWMKQHEECILMRDMKYMPIYRMLDEAEKNRLEKQGIQGFLPLKEGEELEGIVIFGGKKKRGLSMEDVSFLNSIESVSSIALKNARHYERAYREARTDELTGLLNRKYFLNRLERCFARRQEEPLALLIIDVDDFKLYNQLYGDREGDIALQGIGEILQKAVEGIGYAGRYSGKEFGVILLNYNAGTAWTMAEKISRQIRDMNRESGSSYLKTLTVSCGICISSPEMAHTQELIKHADQAVHDLKRSGKNGIRIYSEVQAKRDLPDGEAGAHRSMYSEYAPTIYALTAAIDAKDHYTFRHSKNVAYYAEALGRALHLNEGFIEVLKEAGLLHDIGKIGVPEQILNKRGKLTDAEYLEIKNHVEYSVGIIRHLPSMDYVIPAVIGHHEWYDGNGYPRRVAGRDIPLGARILGVVDSFDAMISKRSYKASIPVEDALEELERCAGTQFDPELVAAFAGLIRSGHLKPVLDSEETESF